MLPSLTGEASAISGTCESAKASKEVDCNLRQTSVRKVLTQKEAEKSLIDVTIGIDKNINEMGEEKLRTKLFGHICPQIDSFLATLKPSQTAAGTVVADICASPTRENFIKMLALEIEIKKQTCKVSENDLGNFSFKKVNPNKWVSNNGPRGLCGAIVVMTLEHTGDKVLWTYSQTKTYTNSTSEICKGLLSVNKPASFGWEGESRIQKDCKYISFGLP